MSRSSQVDDRRKSASELEGFFDLSLDPLCIAGLDGYFKRVNAALERTLGYSERELLSRPFLDLLHPDDLQRTRGVMGKLAAGNDVIEFEARVVCADGSVRWLQWNTRTVPERGVVYGVARDVTDRRRADAELREAQRMVEASREELRLLAEEQAALRRVATRVAEGVPPDETFEVVITEIGRLLPVDSATLGRYENDGALVRPIAFWSSGGEDLVRIGARYPVEPRSLSQLVLESRGPARVDDFADAPGPLGEVARGAGWRSAVGAPVIVDGRVWGLVGVASTTDRALATDTEERLAGFAELLATAISNAQARAEVGRLADGQSALRRVATLVAQERPAAEVFAAVAEEVGRVLQVEDTRIVRYEPDGTLTVVASWGKLETDIPVGTRMTVEGDNVSTMVLRTGRAARKDYYEHASGPIGDRVRELGIRSAVGTPIVVNGKLWGAMVAASLTAGPLPGDTEAHIGEFTELVATAISNIEARSELAASRARIVAAADEERRRVVRDLHDGAQQRLVHAVVTLKLAQEAFDSNPESGPVLVSEALERAERANVDLRELAHGILPSVLTRGGLRAGVEALASQAPVPVEIAVSVDRLPAAIEATAYFIVAEALTNVAKHSRARRAKVTARVENGTLRVTVRDDGVGGARSQGSGLVGLLDRVAALDGRLRVESPAGGGTLVATDIPLPG